MNNNNERKEVAMRKPELAAAIAERADLTKDKAGEVLNVLLDQITQTVAKKESVTLVGFGTFEARSRAKRKGKNPQTGQEIEIPASNTVAFKAGKALKDSVN
jgi:DNA-binding protein HU-alpha